MEFQLNYFVVALPHFQLNWLLYCDVLYEIYWKPISFFASELQASDNHSYNMYRILTPFTRKHIYTYNTQIQQHINSARRTARSLPCRKPISLILLTCNEKQKEKKTKTTWATKIPTKITMKYNLIWIRNKLANWNEQELRGRSISNQFEQFVFLCSAVCFRGRVLDAVAAACVCSQPFYLDFHSNFISRLFPWVTMPDNWIAFLFMIWLFAPLLVFPNCDTVVSDVHLQISMHKKMGSSPDFISIENAFPPMNHRMPLLVIV